MQQVRSLYFALCLLNIVFANDKIKTNRTQETEREGRERGFGNNEAEGIERWLRN